MVDVKELKGWIIDGKVLDSNIDSDEYYFVEDGVRKASVFICGNCEEGWHLKREDAENCCKDSKMEMFK